jgi:type III restriction enzyme
LNLDRSGHVKGWAKNDHLGFEILYMYNGVEHRYRPDFLIRLANDEMLILETKGQETEQDKTKRTALREWIRAVNANGGFGRWHPEPAMSKHPDEMPEILATVSAKSG